jgi:hypothetical protein
VVEEVKKKKNNLPEEALTVLLLGLVSIMGHPVSAFTAYFLHHRSNIVASYLFRYHENVSKKFSAW